MVYGSSIRKIFVYIFILALLLSISGVMVASAADPTPPPPPNDPDATATPSSGGGGSVGSTYSAPSFQPFVMSLLSSNGSVIGSITGKNEYSIILDASNNTSIDGKNFTISMYAEMGQKPSDDTRMDIDLLAPYSGGLPVGMDGATVLGVVNITRYGGNGWNLKLDTLKLTFSVPGTPGTGPNTTYYLIRYDGTSYDTQKVSLKDSSAGTLTFEATPSSDTGLFTLVMSQPFIPTPTATPTPVPTSTPTPTPEPSNMTPTGIGIMMAIFAIGAIAGGTLIFMIFRK